MKLIVKWIGCLALCLCMSCAEQVESPEMVDTFPDIYPDYIAVTVPVGIAPLNFTMKDDCERIDIRMQGVGGKELHMNDTDVDIDIEEWKQLLKASLNNS